MRYSPDRNTGSTPPSLKYSLSVLENRFEYFTNSRRLIVRKWKRKRGCSSMNQLKTDRVIVLTESRNAATDLCSNACFRWGAFVVMPLTASRSFLMAEAISLIVSRKLCRSPICSGTRERTCEEVPLVRSSARGNERDILHFEIKFMKGT